ncbi:MAG TPA: alkaline phosphatase D family protein [Nitrospiraceae bacterium]|jgi:alkaline phosphatase D|nr:alkaline phosphatase D family protein [Nitrospiraceae bacterium]
MRLWLTISLGLVSLGLTLSLTGCSPSSKPGLPPDSPFAETSVSFPDGLSSGIATGDVTDRSAVVWLRTDGPRKIQIEWAPVEEWTRAEADRERAPYLARTLLLETAPEHDYTLKVPIEGLKPGMRYRYQVLVEQQPPEVDSIPAAKVAATGEFVTAPPPGAHAPVTFLWSGDLGGQQRCRDDGAGYPIFDVMRRQQPDFAILLGDLMYSDDTCPSPPNAPGGDFTAATLDEYRAKHRYQRGAPALRRFLAVVPVFTIWDDHEVGNNFAGPYDPRMPIGRQALLEYWPIRTPPDDPARLYRRVRFGADLELFILDTRQYRSRNAEPDGPGKTMLGRAQRAWLLDGLANSTATWKVIATSVPLSNPKAGNLLTPGNDSWARGPDGTGFQTELEQLVEAILSRRIRNVVWLAADVHYVQANAYDPDGDGVADFHEFICGPLSAAYGRPTPPNPVFKPMTLFSDSGYSNFGLVSVKRTTLEVRILDDKGALRATHTLRAR